MARKPLENKKPKTIDELKLEMKKLYIESASQYVSVDQKQIYMDKIDELKKKIRSLEKKNTKIVPVIGADIVANHKETKTRRMSDGSFTL